MRRTSAITIFGSILVAICFVFGGAAEARKKAKPKKAKAPVISAENKKALGELMGAFKFGMSQKEVLGVLTQQLNERYAEKIAATNDVYVQDKLRREKKKALAAVQKSHVKFTGKKGGWDVSLIDDQFAHKTGESMMEYWENQGGKDQRRFFFFFEGKLYKMFIALNTSQIQEDQRNFAYLRTLMESRFGPGDVKPTGIEWKTKEFEVQAIDKMAFYGSFCLVIGDPATKRAVEALRAERNAGDKDGDNVIRAMTAGDDDIPSLDDGKGAIDKAIKAN